MTKHIVTHPATIWDTHTFATFQRNPERGWLELLMLGPIDTVPTTEYGYDEQEYYRDAIFPHYNIDRQMINEVSVEEFNAEVSRRQTHTPEMLEMLRHNYMDMDLTSYFVYGSPIHPMSSAWARIPGAVYFDSDKNASGYHTYVAVPALLDDATVRHYSFVFISHP